ncbi:MAG: hypothetical protein R3C59_01840 [Planctomycetaceae bacterium]
MMLFRMCLCVTAVALTAIALLRSTSVVATEYRLTAAPAIADEPQVVEDSMHEFMEYVFQPTYRRLKVSMAAQPADNAAWKAIKSDSLILAESCNLLFARTPDEGASDWAGHAAASRTDGASLYKAAQAKDFAKATVAYKSMLNNCNACHRQFEDGKHILTP